MATTIKTKAARKSVAKPHSASEDALYLYGISTPSRARVEIHSEAVDGRSGIEAHRIEGFDCWTSRVDRREYAEHLAENMENLEWLATVGVRHQRAVAELASKLEILPARFGTVFLSERSLSEHITRGKKTFSAVLKKIAGSDEWGVKVFRHALPNAAIPTEARSGTDYLKKKAQSVMPRSKQEDPEFLAFVDGLKGASVEMSSGGKASTGQPNLVWHASFLVRRKEQKKFDTVLRKFTASLSDGYRVECSGPWPPYSFVGQHG